MVTKKGNQPFKLADTGSGNWPEGPEGRARITRRDVSEVESEDEGKVSISPFLGHKRFKRLARTC